MTSNITPGQQAAYYYGQFLGFQERFHPESAESIAVREKFERHKIKGSLGLAILIVASFVACKSFVTAMDNYDALFLGRGGSVEELAKEGIKSGLCLGLIAIARRRFSCFQECVDDAAKYGLRLIGKKINEMRLAYLKKEYVRLNGSEPIRIN